MAGITTERDLGTEGAGYADVGLRDAVAGDIIPGPRILAVTRAIVARGSYGVKGAPEWNLPYGAEQVASPDEMEGVVRDQIGRGADWIKLYGDYRWGPRGEARPTLTEEELRRAVEVASASGRYVAVHAVTPEAMRRAALAGVATIEHGNEGTPEVFKLMAERGVGYCPTVAATEAVARYRGWKSGTEPEPASVQQGRDAFRAALAAGVAICFGGDVGVFAHGDNVRELEILVRYGMRPADAVVSATSGNARILHLDDRGSVRPGLLADLIAVGRRSDPGRVCAARRAVRDEGRRGDPAAVETGHWIAFRAAAEARPPGALPPSPRAAGPRVIHGRCSGASPRQPFSSRWDWFRASSWPAFRRTSGRPWSPAATTGPTRC